MLIGVVVMLAIHISVNKQIPAAVIAETQRPNTDKVRRLVPF